MSKKRSLESSAAGGSGFWRRADKAMQTEPTAKRSKGDSYPQTTDIDDECEFLFKKQVSFVVYFST